MSPRGGLVVDWPVLLQWSETLQAIIQGGHLDVFTAYAETGAVVAQHSLTLYQGYLKGHTLPNGSAVQHPSGNLAKHAELAANGFLDWSLKNDESYAEAVERGTKERDMKEALAKSDKARRSKDGHLYLIIPFRHGTQGSIGLRPMPMRVQQMAQALKPSKVSGHFTEPSVHGNGVMVQRNSYKWGGRLSASSLSDAGLSFKMQSRYAGMVRFGNKGHHSYMTFRVMSEKSSGWVIPARPGLWPAKTAAESAFQDGKGALADALLEDLLRLSGI